MESGRFLRAFAAALAVHAVVAVAVLESYSPVKPLLECVEVSPSGRLVTAHFGAMGLADEPVALAIGEANRFSPGEADRGQPTLIAPGRTKSFPHAAFTVTFEGPALAWTLDGQEVVATRLSQACQPPDQQKERPMPVVEQLQKIKPIEKKIENTPKEEPKVVEKEEPKETKKPEEATRKPKNPIRKKGQPKNRKPPTKPPVQVTKAEPAPLVLENVSLKGTVAVQQGEQDLYGDPSVAANDRNVNVEVVDDPDKLPDKVGDGSGGGEAKRPAPPKFVAPRIDVSVGGKWPADAPRLGRTVTVVLSLSVAANGGVDKVRVVKGAGKVFDDAARKVGFRLKFKPGTRDGKPVAMPVRWTVEFRPD